MADGRIGIEMMDKMKQEAKLEGSGSCPFLFYENAFCVTGEFFCDLVYFLFIPQSLWLSH